MRQHPIVRALWGMLLPAAAFAQQGQEDGLVGAWSFDEGHGAVARDSSGHGDDGRIHGASWVQHGDGYALSFDGQTDYVNCGTGPSLDLREALTLEAWVRPTGSPPADALIIGKHYESYALTMYGASGVWFYISSGGNNIKSLLELHAWNHVVGTFDGTTMTLYVNRIKVASGGSRFARIAPGKSFLMGVTEQEPDTNDPARPAAPHFRGELDDVRVFDRALTEAEVQQRYRDAAGAYGVDTSGFGRVRLALYPFPARRQIVAAVDVSGVFPRPAGVALEAAVFPRSGAGPALLRQEFGSVPPTDKQSVFCDVSGLAPGEYIFRARLTGPDGWSVTAEQPFRCPLAAAVVPAPAVRAAGPLPRPPEPPPVGVEIAPAGGIGLCLKGHRLPIVSTLSYPGGGDNLLGVGPGAQCEPEWQVNSRSTRSGLIEVTARGKHYSLTRTLHLLSSHVSVRDAFTNLTDADLGIIVEHRLDAAADPFTASAVAGYPGAGRRSQAESPSLYAGWTDCGLGILPVDDVFVVQSEMYAEGTSAGLLTRSFGLGPKASYTLEWDIYPTDTPDYYEFINRFRQDQGRNGTVEGGFAFVPQTPPMSREHAELRNLAYAAFGCLCNVADDPQIEIEGLEFMWLLRERARLRERFAAHRALNPGLKYMFHIAHSLVTTNKPEQLFPDSRVMEPDGTTQVVYPHDYANSSYFSPQRRQEGYRWFIFYPAPGNSFHELLMKSVDVLVDEIGCGGAFMDGFLFGYGSRHVYDRWDGHTVEIDSATRTVKRRIGNVLLLSQPSMVEFARRMAARGATVVANGIVMTRTIGRLPLVTDQECTSGPMTHLAQTPAALGQAGMIRGETDVYRDVLDKLGWGLLYLYYGEGELTHPSLPQQQYPITIESIHPGTVVGTERLVTARPGVYGWRGDRSLHFGYRYNDFGAPIAAGFLSTVDDAGVRTELDLQPGQSAVLKKLPVTVSALQPVNVMVESCDASAILMSLNGQGAAVLEVRGGDFAVVPGARYRVSGQPGPLAASEAGVLSVPLNLAGPVQLTINRERSPSSSRGRD